jgi:DNA adenine methylase
MSEPNPFLKWVGGKRQLLPELKKYIPEFDRYFEPFVGAGALLFELQTKRAIINDSNFELIQCYLVIRDYSEELIKEFENGYFDTKEDFYRIRSWDRSNNWPTMFKPWEIAARTIYLNKMCFNGLYRVNSGGRFNSPYGKHKTGFNPDIDNIKAVSSYLSSNNVRILNDDFEAAVKDAGEGDFIYFDPPYDPISDTANFTSYTPSGFGKDDQIRLMRLCLELGKRGVKTMVSNANTSFITGLYNDFRFNFFEVQAKRAINSKGDLRGAVSEVIITNYVPAVHT